MGEEIIKSNLITKISKQGKLLEFMGKYELNNLREATIEQLENYIKE